MSNRSIAMAGAFGFLGLLLGGALWSLPHVQTKLTRQSRALAAVQAVPGARLRFHGRDGYLSLLPGTSGGSALAARVAAVPGVRDVQLQVAAASSGTPPETSGPSTTPALMSGHGDLPGAVSEEPAPGVGDVPDGAVEAAQSPAVAAVQASLTHILGKHSIEFVDATAVPTPETEGVIDEVHAVLTAYPRVVILITGHTDSVGSWTSNRALSDARAEAIRAGLLKRGIEGERMRARGLGETRPIASNDTASGRQRNRRVEIDVMEAF